MLKKTIMIDMDNVITDGVFLKYINEYLNTSYQLKDFTNYYFVQELVGDKKEFWEEVSTKNFYQAAPLIDDCFEVLKKLNDEYELYIVTAYIWNEGGRDISDINLKNKYNYLREKLPFISADRYIFATHKKLMNFDIRIDDRAGNLAGAGKKLLFTAWHNKDITDEQLALENITRVNSWIDIEKELLPKKKLKVLNNGGK